jgi:hypothetical protein
MRMSSNQHREYTHFEPFSLTDQNQKGELVELQELERENGEKRNEFKIEVWKPERKNKESYKPDVSRAFLWRIGLD